MLSFLDRSGRRRWARLLVVAVLALWTVPVPAGTNTALAVSVNRDDVVISNVTPGGPVVLLSCARGSRQGRAHVTHSAVSLRDDDGDGTIRFTPDSPILLRSVWIAVDSTSSAAAAGAPAEFPLHVSELVASRFRKDAEGDFFQLEQDLHRLIVLLVRPKSGAWLLSGRDGAEDDADGAVNAKLLLDFALARAIEGKDAAPQKLKADDVVVAVDPNLLDVYVTRVTK